MPKKVFFFLWRNPRMRRCHVLPVVYVFHSVHHFADAGFDEVVQQLLCRKMCSHVRCSIVLKIQTRSKGNWFKTCAPGEQETSQTCQQRALRSQVRNVEWPSLTPSQVSVEKLLHNSRRCRTKVKCLQEYWNCIVWNGCATRIKSE